MTLVEARNIIANPKSTKKQLVLAGKYLMMLLLTRSEKQQITSEQVRRKIHKCYPSSVPYSIRGSMDLTAPYRPYESIRASDDLTKGNDY